MLRTESWKDT
jgi:phenylalanyl-tRNA synthetase alpha chain